MKQDLAAQAHEWANGMMEADYGRDWERNLHNRTKFFKLHLKRLRELQAEFSLGEGLGEALAVS